MPLRYWVPMSLPWRMPWVGSWFSQKAFEQAVVGDHGRIEDDQHGFGVAGRAAADLVVGRVGREAADVTDGRHMHARQLPEDSLGAPEATQREDRGLEALRPRTVQRAAVDEVVRARVDRRLAPGRGGGGVGHRGRATEDHLNRRLTPGAAARAGCLATVAERERDRSNHWRATAGGKPLRGDAQVALLAAYGLLAFAAVGRGSYELAVKFNEAPAAYALSAFAAVIYCIGVWGIWRADRFAVRIARVAVGFELAGVLIVGTLTLFDDEIFPTGTVWSLLRPRLRLAAAGRSVLRDCGGC